MIKPIDDLEQAIQNLTARMTATEYDLLVLIREFDERGGWLRWGFRNCSEWLQWRCDMSASVTRDRVRVAHALKHLPAISSAFGSGALSYSKVRALTRVASARTESDLLELALQTTAARVEERCRALRNGDPASSVDARRRERKRQLSTFVADGMMTINVQVPMQDGQLIANALDQAIEQTGPECEDSWASQRADALVAVARQYLAGNEETSATCADHYQVVIHVDQTVLNQDNGESDVPVETAKRLTCDGSTVALLENDQGEPLNVGRKQRTVPTAIKRALWARDQGCSFPGCTNRHFIDAHHVKHWSDGGETSLANLMLLCSRHHRMVHEEGYEIRKDHKGDRYFMRPDGRAIPAHGYRPDDVTPDPCLLDGASAEAWFANVTKKLPGSPESRYPRD